MGWSYITPTERGTKIVDTKAPTGLAMKREGWNFTCSWKIGDSDYSDGQWFMWGYSIRSELNPQAYNSDGSPKHADRTMTANDYVSSEIKIGSQDTSRTITVPSNVCFPAQASKYLMCVWFMVKGDRAQYKQKENVDGGTYDVIYSPKPSSIAQYNYFIAVPLIAKSLTTSLSTYNKCTFNWEFTVDDTSKEMTTKYEWEAILLKDSSITDGSKVTFKTTDSTYLSGNGTAMTGSYQITEDATAQGWRTTNTYTRWMRIRGVGPRGYGPWRYAKHVYAQPNAAGINYGTITKKTAQTMLVYMKWTLDVNARRPVDKIEAQYLIGTPVDANFTAPSSGWADSPIGEMTDTSGTDGVSFVADDVPDLDECVWGRIVSTYDNDSIYSSPYLLYRGGLSAPSSLNVTTNSSTHMATVSATNNSSVPGTWLAVVYYDATDYKSGIVIGRITSSDSGSVNVQCPDWGSHSISFGVYAVHGTYTTSQLKGNSAVTVYSITPKMVSTTVTDGGQVPLAPSNVTVSPYSISETVNVSWTWNWTGAELAELSWADHEDAWISTSGPTTYTVDRIEAPSWNISGLSLGKTWYIRVRFGNTVDGNTTYGPYSDTKTIEVMVDPEPPVLNLSKTVITENETVTATWTYPSYDGSAQAAADLAIVTYSNNELVYTNKVHATTAQRAELDASKMGWTNGNTYSLAVCVTSDTGRVSEWSSPVSISIADPVTATITQDSFEHDYVVTSDDGSTRTITALTELPLSVTVIGAGASNTTVLTITRSSEYHIDRPDETRFDGYEGETIVVMSRIGNGQFTVSKEDLIGHLDDSGQYTLTATVSDDLGQVARASIDFEVYWDHQAIVPDATVIIDGDHRVAVITPIAPDGTEEGDVCDIYRLSMDRPELVYEGAEFGSLYVDPYPSIGEMSGYRFVFRTANNDYITADNKIAWFDVATPITSIYHFIDFGTEHVDLMYNVDLSTKWTKDFKETKYLGGGVQGDWNPAISRTGTISAVAVFSDDPYTIEKMRRLAVYPGICRVRTRDGSNYSADVQVSESRGHEELDLTADFSMTVTRVDTDEPAGMTYDAWADTVAGVTRYLSVIMTEDDETMKYTVTYSVFSSETKTTLVITKITASGTWTSGTAKLQILSDDVEIYPFTVIDGVVTVSLTDEFTRTTEEYSKELTLVARSIVSTTSGMITLNEIAHEETATAYVNVPALESEEG